MASVFPHSRLFVRSSLTVAISGPHIQILDTATGAILHATTVFDDVRKNDLAKSGPVRCAEIDSSGRYLATSGDDKKLKVWEVDGLKLLSERELPKKPTGIKFARDSQTILVSDKFGDVFRYPLYPTGSHPAPHPNKDALASHENIWGDLVLGHTSLLTSFLLSFDEKYIITADRDEHIRVSWYPEGWSIERFCLGHKKFVSAIHIPAFAQDLLVSGGGDPVIKIWDWMEGVVRCEVRILEAVEPFIAVRPPKRRRSDGDDDGGGEDGADGEEEERKPAGPKPRGKGKQKSKARDDSVEVEALVSIEEEGDPVLVLHKISSLNHSRQLIFSAVGATALFTCTFPSHDHPSAVQPFDFGSPVIDFEVDGEWVWVLLDPARGREGEAVVKQVRYTNGEFIISSSNPPLLNSLNTTCLIPATPADLLTLDIYLPLSALPKRTSPEHVRATKREPQKEKELTKRKLGRLRSKQLLQSQTQRAEEDEEEEEEEDDEDERHEEKRPRSESDGANASRMDES